MTESRDSEKERVKRGKGGERRRKEIGQTDMERHYEECRELKECVREESERERQSVCVCVCVCVCV